MLHIKHKNFSSYHVSFLFYQNMPCIAVLPCPIAIVLQIRYLVACPKNRMGSANLEGLALLSCSLLPQITMKVRQGNHVHTCGTSYKITDLSSPRWQWDMEGLLCKACFDKKESSHDKKKNFCVLCGAKMGIIRYNPKPKWKVNGNLCRKCWDGQKAQFG